MAIPAPAPATAATDPGITVNGVQYALPASFGDISSPTTTGMSLPADLPISTDPAFMIFQANTGLNHDLSNIGISEKQAAISRNLGVEQKGLQNQYGQAQDKLATSMEQRGLSRSGIAANQGALLGQRYSDAAAAASQKAAGQSQTLQEQSQLLGMKSGASLADAAMKAGMSIAGGGGTGGSSAGVSATSAGGAK